MHQVEQDEYWMGIALEEALNAAKSKEVPVGAVLVQEGALIARAHNRVEEKQCALEHAEYQVLRSSCSFLQSKYLPKATLYITLEPCPMCAMACFWTQVGTIVWGADDPKRGFAQLSPHLLHPKSQKRKGIRAEESKVLLQSFFQRLRKETNICS